MATAYDFLPKARDEEAHPASRAPWQDKLGGRFVQQGSGDAYATRFAHFKTDNPYDFSPENIDYHYALTRSGQWTRTANDRLWKDAEKTGNWAFLNGKKTYDVLDSSGNVERTETYSNLDNGDNTDLWVMAAVGGVFAGVAVGAAATAAGGATATAEGGAVAATGATAETGALASSGAGFVGEGAASGVAAWDGALATAQGVSSTVATAGGIAAGDALTYAKGALSLASTVKSAAALFGGSGGSAGGVAGGTLTLPVSAKEKTTLVPIPVSAAGDGGASGGNAGSGEKTAGTNWLLILALVGGGLALAQYMKGK